MQVHRPNAPTGLFLPELIADGTSVVALDPYEGDAGDVAVAVVWVLFAPNTIPHIDPQSHSNSCDDPTVDCAQSTLSRHYSA